MPITAQLYDGTLLEFPDETNQSVIEATAKRVTLERQAATPKEQAGFGSSFMESAKQLLGGKQAATFAYGSPEEQAAARAEMSKPSDRESTSPLDVIAGKGKFSDMLAQGAGGTLGAMAVPYLGAVGANLMKGPGAAKLVGAGLMGAQYLVGGLDRQAQEQTAAIAKGEAPEETSVGKAAVAAAGSTGLDVIGMKVFAPVFKMFPMMGKILGAEGDDAAKIASTQLIDAYKNKSLTYTKGIAQGIGLGMAFEIPQEIAQTALERWQAGLSLSNTDALKEYFNSGAMASILGGAMGGARGGIKTAQDRGMAQQAIEEKRAAEEPVIPTGNPVSASPIVATMKIDNGGVESIKTTHEDGSVDIDGVQVYDPNAEASVVPEAPEASDAASAVPIEKIKNPKTPEEYAQELSRLQAVINNPAETKGHVNGAKARFNRLTAEQIKNAEGAKDAEDSAALDEVANKKGVGDATGIPTGELNDGTATGGVKSVIPAAMPEAPAGELAPSVGVAAVGDVVGESDAGKAAELAALEKAKVEEAARIAAALEAEKAKVEEAAALEAEKVRAEKLVTDTEAKADAEEAARIAAATVVEDAPVTDIKTASANLFKASKKRKNAQKAYDKAEGALATNDPKLKIAREKLRVADEEHRAERQLFADIAKKTTKEPTTTTPLSTGEFGQLIAPEKQLTKAEERDKKKAANLAQQQQANKAAKLSTEEKIDFKSEDENVADVATDIRIASDNISGGHTASPTKHKTLDLFKPSLQTLIDAAEGVTSAATETERRLAAKEITRLSSSNVINEKDINAARGELSKIEEKFEKRTALSKESHEQFVANRRAEAAIANEIQNITYGIDTKKNVRVKVEGKVAVPELEAALKIAKAKTRADLKATKVTADAAGTSNIAPRRADTSKKAGKVTALTPEEQAEAEETQDERDAEQIKIKDKAIAAFSKRIGVRVSAQDKPATIADEVSADEDIDPDTLLRSPPRAEEGAKGMDVADVQDAVDQIKAAWKGSPPILVRQSIKDLPAREAMWLINNNKTTTPGVFIATGPYKGTVFVVADNLTNKGDVFYTVVHEVIGHYGLRTILGDKYDGAMNSAYFNSKIKKEADRIRAANTYDGDAEPMSKAESVEEALAELSEREYLRDDVIRGIVDKVIDAIRGFIRKYFGDNILKGMTDVEIRRLIYASRSLIETGKGAGSGEVSSKSNMMSAPRKPTTKQAPPATSRTVEQMTQDFVNIKAPDAPFKKGLIPAIKAQVTHEGYNSLVRRFQNDRVAIKVLGQFMADAGVLESSGPNANNVFDRITNATGKAQDNIKRYTDYLIRDAQKAVLAYAKDNKLSIDMALGKLHVLKMAMHETERRREKWHRKVPLNDNIVTDSKIVGIMGAGHKAADMRELVYKMLDERKSKKNPLPEDLSTVVKYLAANHADERGFSENRANNPAKPMSKDINDSAYNVVGQYLPADIALLKAEYKAELAKYPSLKALETALKELNKNTIMLDKKANYWTEQVDNYKEFYAYEYYVPFKGNKINTNDDKYSQSGGYETALVKNQLGFEGSIKDSTNSIEQMFADANAAAMRAGYVGVTESIKNAMGFNKTDAKGNPLGKQYIKGELVKVIRFGDRKKELAKDEWAIKGPSNFFHYTADGNIEVYKFGKEKESAAEAKESKAIQESIRRSWEPSHPFIEALNKLTSTVGSMHTRYNPSFAPMDFIRNSFFNAGIFSVDFGLLKGTEYAATVARMVSQNGLMKSWKVAQLYEEGGPANMATLKQMAAKDPFVGTLTEWLKAGGRISYVQGMTLRSQQESLRNEVGRSKVIRTKEQFDKWADMWANSFEFTSRAAAYAVAKAEYKARNIAKGMSPAAAEASAIEQATAYAKNLANFEQIGEHGRLAGALFMFFRPAATGAVRALDSVLPAFQNTSTMIDKLPDEIKNDPKAVETYRKEHQAKKKHAKHIMLTMAGSGALIYTMALAMAGEDDEGRNKVATDNMAQWTRYARLPIPGTDTFIQIPWGFGLGAFAAFGAQVAGAAFGKTGWGEMAANLVPVAMDSFIPIPVSRISPIDNPMAFVVDSIFPSIGRPFLEYTMNVDSMGRQIYKDKQTRFGDAYLSKDQVPEIYKDVARWLVNTTAGSTLPLMPADVSPSTLYFFANNYIDGLSRLFLNTPYNLGLVLAGQKDFDIKRDAFVFDSFIGKAANYDARQFSSTERQIRDMERKINMFKTDPTVYADYLDANPMAKTIVDTFNKQVAQLNKASSISKKLRLDSTLTPKELKEALEDSKLNENAIRRNIVEMFKDYDVHP